MSLSKQTHSSPTSMAASKLKTLQAKTLNIMNKTKEKTYTLHKSLSAKSLTHHHIIRNKISNAVIRKRSHSTDRLKDRMNKIHSCAARVTGHNTGIKGTTSTLLLVAGLLVMNHDANNRDTPERDLQAAPESPSFQNSNHQGTFHNSRPNNHFPPPLIRPGPAGHQSNNFRQQPKSPNFQNNNHQRTFRNNRPNKHFPPTLMGQDPAEHWFNPFGQQPKPPNFQNNNHIAQNNQQQHQYNNYKNY